MAYENSGRLFKNDRKQPGDNLPDYTGDLTDATGKKWRLAAWIKKGERGKWMSLKVSEDTSESYRDTAQPVRPQEPQEPADGEQDGPLPF